MEPLAGDLVRASKAITVRYERERLWELAHADVEKLDHIPDGGCRKGTVRRRRSLERDRGVNVGFNSVHSLVDDHSKLAYSEILADEEAPPEQASWNG